ncbi:hypothetical protein KUF71_008330 [Frankliniella fusca]|uniref:Uncharacterized protein n=1 Tax=Frankliniella fusca TaxID=407009 RepID=A0AAE1HD42_9NEOP|nr:hypothetical protein KUF71_008330 [Frankliniella fusca]
MKAITRRHNNIQDLVTDGIKSLPCKEIRIDKTIPFQQLSSQVIPQELQQLQPDIVVINKVAKTIDIVRSWLGSNYQVLKTLGLTNAYSNTLARFACSTSIKWSRDIYVEHVSGRQHYQ